MFSDRMIDDHSAGHETAGRNNYYYWTVCPFWDGASSCIIIHLVGNQTCLVETPSSQEVTKNYDQSLVARSPRKTNFVWASKVGRFGGCFAQEGLKKERIGGKRLWLLYKVSNG